MLLSYTLPLKLPFINRITVGATESAAPAVVKRAKKCLSFILRDWFSEGKLISATADCHKTKPNFSCQGQLPVSLRPLVWGEGAVVHRLSLVRTDQPFIALDTSYLFLLFRSFQFYCPFWGCCAWDFRVGVVSHCTMGMFWGLQHFCYWLVQRYAWNWVKIRPPLKTVPWCNSILLRPSLQGNFKWPTFKMLKFWRNSEAFWSFFYIWFGFLYIQVSWELRDNGVVKNLQFWP